MNNMLHSDIGTASSNLDVRAYTPKDYEMVTRWWKAWDSPIIDQEFLSDIGLIVGESAACWLYTTNSGLCFLDTCVSDPDSEYRDEAIDKVIYELTQIAIEKGCKLIYAVPAKPKLIKRALNQGWGIMNENLTQVGARICHQ